MGTIIARKRATGMRYTAFIRIKRSGVIIHSESETFDKRTVAAAWMKKREVELAQPGALADRDDPPLSEAIEKYVSTSIRKIGRTKAQVLRTIAAAPIGRTPCSRVDSEAIVAFTVSLDAQPSTRENYLSHLGAVFAVARPAWGIPLDHEQIGAARKVLKRLGATGKSKHRTRRVECGELDKLLTAYQVAEYESRTDIDMIAVVLFALFSTRRQDEITRLRWADFDKDRILVRDMKHPGQKVGNDTLCDLPPEAVRIIQSRPREGEYIFPYKPRSISASFARTCKFLGIEDLHFHDLRHEGTSRLFEMGWTIPHVAAVTGHRSWASLKRYTHVRLQGDRWATFPWITPWVPRPS
jgi:integrase